MTTASVKSHFAGWRGWELNPVVVKELRQAVRSWAVTGMLLLFLLALFITMIVVLLAQSVDTSVNSQIGGDVFAAFLGILAVASILFIPLYVGIRMAAERVENNTDLLYISTLSPARIIFGKCLCGGYMTLLFFSACMPFMALTNLLRGVDLPTVFFCLAFLFVTVCAANQLAIFIACLSLSRAFKVLLALGQFFVSFYFIAAVMSLSFELMRFGIGSMVIERTFWVGTASAAGVVAAAGGLLFVLCVALISPPSANRALLTRIYVTVFWLLGAALAAYWAWSEKQPQVIFVWTILSTVLLVASLLVVISNRDQLSFRVQRTIPKSRLLRAIALPFFNGAAGGLVWVATLLFLTYWGTAEFYSTSVPRSTFIAEHTSDFFSTYVPLLLYIFAYALTALFIQRKFLPRRSPKLAGYFALIIAAVAGLGPDVVMFFLNQLTWHSVDHLQLGNASNLFARLTPEDLSAHLTFSAGWVAVAAVINTKWFLAQLNDFHRPAKPALALEPAQLVAAISS